MIGAFMICIGVVLVLMALILVLPTTEPDGTTRDGIAGAAVVLARRCGPPNVHIMDRDELALAEDAFVARSIQYFENLEIPIQA